ncbi:Rieske (2Fe-2S) protein [Ornithinimicrobium humiphilum]|uniref:Cytochrome bc1 complex Rieske iron-sulfur subunit n=1 Tax=Ornithinimicrobium humiphilum TaxID=125288 RepID=A0A543KPH3_9MICO|nr:Rieske (2Fe-2S) protein [Ornithinimicrobium humiphilum]TQM96971.1 nitrite reductase/ring-hydroxylating ferredoxin subunit [Ornithinimicrobium humiphilum]
MPDLSTVPADQGPGAARTCCASRRQVLRAAGATALVPAGVTALAGCGPDGGGSEPTVADDGTVTVPAADTPVGGATYYADPGLVVTQPTEGEFHAYDATCPHQGCAASLFEDGRVVCPCHGSAFDPATGDVVDGPAETGLTARTVTLDGGDLQIRG